MTETPDLYKILLDYLNNAVVVIDDRCQIKYLNQAAQSILGLSSSRADSLDISTVLTSNKSEQLALLDSLNDRSSFTKREKTIRNEQGKDAIIDYSLTPFDLGTETLFVIEIQEINRLVRISREESILATQDTTRQLVRGLAHEVKNPLGGIRGAAQLLQNELDNDELKEYTTIITEETDRLRNLVDQMLGPNTPPDLNVLNIHEVLEHVLALISAETKHRVSVVKDYDPSLPEILGDNHQLIQAILNIARNAIEALVESDTSDPKLIVRSRIQRRFTVGQMQHPLVARIDFQDNGPGIPDELISEIFYPMITGRPHGTGLGLPIAQSILNRHQGLIECTSRPGETIFSLYIPIYSGSPYSSSAEQAKTNP